MHELHTREKLMPTTRQKEVTWDNVLEQFSPSLGTNNMTEDVFSFLSINNKS